MTSVVNRPRPRPARPAEPPPTSPTLAGVYAALRAAGLGLLVVAVPVLVAWATATGSGASAGEAVRSALQVWLLAHGGRLRTPTATIGVLPLGLTALAGVLIALSAGRAAKAAQVRTRRPAVQLVWVASSTYALVAALVSVPAGSSQVRPGTVGAVLGAFALCGVCSGVSVARAAGLLPRLWLRVPQWWRAPAAAAAAALAVLVTGGALVAAMATVGHLGRTADLTDRLGAGWVGALVLALVSLALVPNAVVAGLAYVTGAGFAVGTGTVVAPGQVTLGAVPALPVLGGLPDHAVPVLGWAALLVPLAAGVLAGRVVTCGTDWDASWRDRLARAGAAGLLTGVMVAVLALLASGSAGAHRLRHVGPVWWQVGPLAGLEVALVGVAAVVVLTWQARRSVS